MYFLRGILQCISLVLLSTQPIFSEIIRFNDGGITYEYDNSSTPLGEGSFGNIYEGIRTDGNQSESVAFKELADSHGSLLKEAHISAILGQHDSFPNFYRYFPETNETKPVFVMERIGKTLNGLWMEFHPFSPITVLQIGLQTLGALEWMHSIGITHNDLHYNNIAVGHHNKSKIFIFDFSLACHIRNSETSDLSQLSSTLNELLRSNRLDEAYESNSALNEFDLIAEEYHNIYDHVSRNETFTELRSILMEELESHKNDADYEKYVDIAYIQDTVDGLNLLRKSIKQSDTSAIESLLQSDQGVNVNAGFGNSLYYKPIHLAAELGDVNVVQLLLDHGAEVNTKYDDTHYAWSPLHYAAVNGNNECVRLLCTHGAEINAKLFSGRTPLHWAATLNKIEAVRALCECGANTNIKDNDGNTPFYYAAYYNKVDLVDILAQHGADIDALNDEGKTTLYDSFRFGRLKMAGVLIENGANINFKYDDGSTPLHYAARHDSVEVAKLLTERGAKVNASGTNGKTPLHNAAENGCANVLSFLIERGADIKAKNSHGKTALAIVLEKSKYETGYEEVIKILREAGQKSA